MLSDRHVTALACRDSGYIQRIAPHLLFRIPFLLPFTTRKEGATLRDRAAWYATEVYVGTYDLFQPLKRGKPSTRLTADELYRLEPGLRPGLHGAVTLDEWGIDAFRLCVLNALSARAHGADAPDLDRGARGAGRGRARARRPLSATCSPARRARRARRSCSTRPARGRPRSRGGAARAVPMRPGKGVHLTLDRRYSNYGVILSAVDGRQMFVMPHESESIVGTTDDDYYGDPDDLEATNDEVEYLIEGAASLLPGVRNARDHARVVRPAHDDLRVRAERGRALARAPAPRRRRLGARRAPLDRGREARELPRAGRGGDGPRSWRSSGGAPVACRTHEEPLPGGDDVPDAGRARARRTRSPRRSRRGSSTATAAARARDPPARRGGPAPRPRALPRRGDPRRGGGPLRPARAGAAAPGSPPPLPRRGRRVRRARLRAHRGAARRRASSAGRRSSVGAELADLLDAGWRERRPVLDGAQLVAGGARARGARRRGGALVSGGQAIAADVLVVGGGMAGTHRGARGARRGRAAWCSCAARPARPRSPPARSASRRIRCALPGEPLSASRGAVEAARRLARLRPDHPYALLGQRARVARRTRSASRPRALAPLLAPPLERPRFLATPFGTVVAAALCQRSHGERRSPRRRGPARGRRPRAVTSPSTPRSSRRVSSAIAPRGGPPVRAVEVDPGLRDLALLRPHELARALEAARRGRGARRARSARRCPTARARRSSRPCSASTPAARVPERVAAAAGVPVAEALSDVPSVPGVRLQASLEAALAAAGVRGRPGLAGGRRRARRAAADVGDTRITRAALGARHRAVRGRRRRPARHAASRRRSGSRCRRRRGARPASISRRVPPRRSPLRDADARRSRSSPPGCASTPCSARSTRADAPPPTGCSPPARWWAATSMRPTAPASGWPS